jgi:preprotein translocase subunit YajC
MTTVPVIVPMTTIQIPPQQQQQQQQQDQSKQVGLDPFDEIVCRGQNGE